MPTNKQEQKPQTDQKSEDKSKSSGKSTQAASEAEAQPDQETLQKFESLSELLQGELSEIKPEDATGLIDEWYGLVHKSKEPELKEIASGLKDMQKLLKSEGAGHDLGELLCHLGEQTSEIATDAEKTLKAPLQQLGKQLAKIGKSLAKEEDQQHLESLDSLVQTLGQDADEIDAKAAGGDIDEWYNFLNKSEEESLKSIANELKELKQLLKGSKTKGADISEKLIALGEHTTEAASEAGRGFKGMIKQLGKALTKLGKSIE